MIKVYYTKATKHGWRYALVVDDENKLVQFTDCKHVPEHADLVIEELLPHELRSIARQSVRNDYTVPDNFIQ